MTTTIGYLSPDPTHGGVSLAVPCEPCRAFHWHGAGTIDRPFYAPGDLTDRVSHCPNGNEYSAIRIVEQPYRRTWLTPGRGRFSAEYRRDVQR